MTREAEYEAAYFTLLRARDELATLLRYQELLDAEVRRLDAFSTAVRDAFDPLPRAYRKNIDATAKPLLEAVGRRRSTVLSELERLPGRLTAAQAFVEECERDLASLR